MGYTYSFIDSNAIIVYEFVAIASLLLLVLGGERIATIVRLQKKTLALALPSFDVHTSVVPR